MIFRDSAVLILFYQEWDSIRTVLIKRPEYPGAHSGQVSFPGGRREKEDTDLIRTALREAEEETGIDRCNIRVLGHISEILIPPSRFRVLPVVAIYEGTPLFKPDPVEVESLLFPDLNSLLAEDALHKEYVNIGMFGRIQVPAYRHGEHVIWGATAMMLTEMLDIIKR